MGNLSSLTLMLGANIKDFQTKMHKATQQLAKTGEQMKGIGKGMSMYVTAPLAAMGAASLAAFDKQAQAEAKLAAQIRQNGKDVQSTMADYKTFASNLQNVTTVGDETTLALMQMAESMGASNVKAVTQGAVGLSKALGVDLQSAIKMTTLAEQGNFTMLQRYVPALKSAGTEAEKTAILSKLYADGLAIAQSEAQTGLGPLKQLQNSLGDLSESFGAIVADAIAPAVKWLKQIVDRFQSLSDGGKRTIAIIAGIAAAIGPLVVVMGTLGAALPAIAAGFSMMLGPIGLVVAAIAAIGAAFVYLYGNWEAVKERLGDWTWWKNSLIQAAQWLIEYSPISLLIKGINELVTFLGGDPIPNPFESLGDYLSTAKSETAAYKNEFMSFGKTITSVMGEATQAMGLFSTQANVGMNAGTASIRQALPVFDTLKMKVGDLRSELAVKIDPLPFDQKAFDESLSKATTGLNNFKSTMSEAYTSAVNGMNDAFSTAIQSMAVTIGEGIGNLLSGVEPNLGAGVLGVIGGFLKSLGKALIVYAGVIEIFKKTISNPWVAMAVGIAAVAAGQVFMNIANRGAKMKEGGIVPPGFPNDTFPALLSSGETVIPSPIPLDGSWVDGGIKSTSMRISGSTRITGKDLLVVFDKAVNDRSYTRG